MSYYRDKYLKSEDWKSLRKERIFRDGFRCALCHQRPKRHSRKFGSGLDVHHLDYKKLHDVEPSDLRTLCRSCHDRVHKLMEKYPKLKTLPRVVQWQTVIYHLMPDRRPTIAGAIKGVDEKGKACRQEPVKGKPKSEVLVFDAFCEMKRSLIASGLICKHRMAWRDEFGSNQKIAAAKTPTDLLAAYIEISGRDPRRLIPDIYRPWPKWMEAHSK